MDRYYWTRSRARQIAFVALTTLITALMALALGERGVVHVAGFAIWGFIGSAGALLLGRRRGRF